MDAQTITRPAGAANLYSSFDEAAQASMRNAYNIGCFYAMVDLNPRCDFRMTGRDIVCFMGAPVTGLDRRYIIIKAETKTEWYRQ